MKTSKKTYKKVSRLYLTVMAVTLALMMLWSVEADSSITILESYSVESDFVEPVF